MIDSGGGYLEFRKERTKKIKTKGKGKAKKVAKKTLRESLKQEYGIHLSLNGDVSYCAGGIIELDETFGRFSGKYIIEKVIHSISGEYTCEIEAYRIGARKEAEERAKKKAREEEAAKKREKEKLKKKKKVIDKDAGYIETRRS